MQKLLLFLLILFTVPIFGQDIDRFCNENACGDLEPNWELAGQTVVCEGEDFNLSSGSSKPLGNISNYYWFIEDLATNNVLFDTAFTDTTLLTYNYSLSDSAACLFANDKVTLQVRLVINSEECSNGNRSCRFVTKPLTVFLKPRADFSLNSTVCIGEDIQLNNLSCHGKSYEWDFGDGDSSTEDSPSKSFDIPGTYTIQLKTSNDCGGDFITKQVRVVGEPEADFVVDLGDGSFCLPKVLDLTDKSNSFSSIRWDITPRNGWEFTDTLMTENTSNIQIRFLQSGEFRIRMVASNNCPQDDELVEMVTIFSPPSIRMEESLSFCDQATINSNDLNFAVSGDYEQVSWRFESASASTITGESFSDITFNQSGKVIVTVEGNCETLIDTADIFVASTEPITFAPENPAELCQNSSTIQLLANPTGGRWEGPGNIQVDGTLDPANLNPGTYDFTYTAGTDTCPNEASLEITILPPVSVQLSTIEPACEQFDFTPQVQYSGAIDSYIWTFPGGSPSSSSLANPANIQFSVADTFDIEVKVTGKCGIDSARAEIQLQYPEPVQIQPIDQPLCSGSDPIQLSAGPAGGSWQGNGVNSSGVFDPGSVSPNQTHTIRYENNDGACSGAAEIKIEVVSSAEISLSDDLFCEEGPVKNLTVSPVGGTWRGMGIIDSLSGLFDPKVAQVGSFSVSYTYTDENNCTVTANANMVVEALPVLQTLDTLQLCLADFDANLMELANYQATPNGGETFWSGPGITDGNTSTFNAGSSNLNPGLYTIRVQYSRNECTVLDSFVIDLIEAEELQVSPDTTICISEESLQLNTNLQGGTWQGPGIQPDGIIDLTIAGGGTFHYQYSFGSGTSCAQQGNVQVEIIDLGSQIATGGEQSACEGSKTAHLTGASPAGGFWQGPGIIDSDNGVIDLTQLETEIVYTYQYCLESSAVASCQACRPKTFILHHKPKADFSLDGSACINQQFGMDNLSIGALQFDWAFGDGNQSNSSSPIHTYTQAGTFDLQLVATSEFGCKDTSLQSIYVTTPPAVSFSLNADEGCAPFQVLARNRSMGDSLSFLWKVGEDEYPVFELDSVWIDRITEDTKIPIILEVSNFCGTVNQIDSILVHPYPVVNFGISEDEGCSPLKIDLINTTQGQPDSYSWDFGDGSISSEFEPDPPLFSTSDTLISRYTIRLTASNSCGVDSLEKEITVFPPNVEAFIELDTLEACSPLAFQLKSVSTPGARLSWTFIDPLGRESGSAMENPTLTLAEPGLHTFILSASSCGTDMDTAQVNILPAPELQFEHKPFVCVGQPVQFYNLSEGINGSIWNFGDDQENNERSPIHTFDSVGTYTVTLTAFSESNNCPNTITSTIKVVGLPTAAFESDLTQGCGPLKVNFSNTSPNAGDLRFVWDFGDGSSRVFTQNAKHTFVEPGNYQVMLTAYNADSCYADTTLLTIFVFDDPVSSFEVEEDRFCAGIDSLQLLNTSIDAVSFQWEINSDTFVSKHLTYPLLEPIEYQVQLVVKNNFQCADTSLKVIRANPTAKADFAPTVTEGCESLWVGFRQNSTDADQYFWEFGDGNTSTDVAPTHLFRESGTYTITLTAIKNNGCPGDTTQSIVNVLKKPKAAFAFGKPDNCGTPAEVIFTNQSTDNLDNFWDFGDGASSDETQPSYFYVDYGPKTIKLVVENSNGCRDTTQQIIDIFGKPVAQFDLSTENGCENDTIQIINNSAESIAFSWQLEGQGSSIETAPSLVYSRAGTYQIELIAAYNDLCKDTLTKEIKVFQAPIADFNYQADFNPSVLGEIQFNNLTVQGERFLWDFGDGNISNEVSPYHEYLVNRSLNVSLTAYNENQGLFTCVDTITKPVDPEWLATFYAPNALAPSFENDGIRYFKPVGTGLKDYLIEVYSPWGTVVWQSRELDNGQPVGVWDGTYNGKELPQGAYTWVATMTFEDGNKQRKVGTVTILR